MAALTYEQFRQLARQHYEVGGMGYASCWDERTFAYWVHEYGPLTKAGALAMFAAAHDEEQQRKGGSADAAQ